MLYNRVLNSAYFPPHNIWNVDETGIVTNHKAQRLVSRRGRKQISQITGGEKGKLVTAIFAINAAGTLLFFLVF